MTNRLLGTAMAWVVLSFVAAPADEVEVEDLELVYHGEADFAERAATVSADRVFLAIPAYRRIAEEGLSREDPGYWLLLEEANRIFRQAVARVARARRVDVVGEAGSITVGGVPAPDLTDAVVDAVEGLLRRGG